MEAVTKTDSAAAVLTANKTSGGFTSKLNQEDFLKLLVAQMKSQDPLNPQDPMEFTNQLTQFSQLEQLLNIKAALLDVASGQKSLEQAQATDYIGKTVRAKGSGIEISGGQASPITYELPSAAATVTIHVKNSSGQVVRTLEQTLVGAGTQSAPFDGNDTLGQPLPDGTYTVSITAQDATGTVVPVSLFKTGVVTGVNLEGEEPTILVGNQKIKLKDVLEILAGPKA